MSELRAMVLAAGRGDRLRPLTDSLPKPLIEVGGKPLIEHALDRLAAAGVRHCVVNVSWLGEQIRDHLQRHWRWDMSLQISDEGPNRLETGGGIFKALPLLGSAPFLVVNADVYCDLDFGELAEHAMHWSDDLLGHLILVDNPVHNPAGDFTLDGQYVRLDGERLTYSGIALLHPALFAGCDVGAFPLAPLLRRAIRQNRLGGEHYQGLWTDVGSPERLAQIRQQLSEAH